jgi:hypothetical protein
MRRRIRQIGERRVLGDKLGALFSAEGWPVIHAAQKSRLTSSAAQRSAASRSAKYIQWV